MLISGVVVDMLKIAKSWVYLKSADFGAPSMLCLEIFVVFVASVLIAATGGWKYCN